MNGQERIWKFRIDVRTPMLPLPPGAQLLHVAAIDEIPYVWAVVVPCAPRDFVMRRLHVCLTGDRPLYDTYIGTFLLDGGAFVGHLYDGGDM